MISMDTMDCVCVIGIVVVIGVGVVLFCIIMHYC